jgi:3-oxoacyl-[acyl-carrier-protein] synthase-3
MDDDFVRGKLGIHEVSRKQPDEDTSSLCVEAFHALTAKTTVQIENIDFLVVCSQNPDGNGIPHTSAIVHGALGLRDDCAAFDIGLGCSGYVYSLSIARSFMEANKLKTGLIFTSDPYSKILDPKDRTTEMLFGDAATVTLLDSCADGSGAGLPYGFQFSTRGSEGAALCNDSGRLRMNGRAVFNFSAIAVPEQVHRALAAEKLDAGEVDRFLFHQGSKYIVDTLTKRLGLPPEKVPSNLTGQGNTVSSSIPLLFEKQLHDPSIELVLMSGFGVGLSWATCFARRL